MRSTCLGWEGEACDIRDMELSRDGIFVSFDPHCIIIGLKRSISIELLGQKSHAYQTLAAAGDPGKGTATTPQKGQC